MTRLKLSDIAAEKPVRLTIEISARLHRELIAYAVAINEGEEKGAPSLARIIPPIVDRFIANDRGFAKARRSLRSDQNLTIE